MLSLAPLIALTCLCVALALHTALTRSRVRGLTSSSSSTEQHPLLQRTGAQLARKALEAPLLAEVELAQNQEAQRSFYDPQSKRLVLASDVYFGDTPESLAIAAHEVAHAEQDRDASSLLHIASRVLLFCSLMTSIGVILVLASLLLELPAPVYALIGPCLAFIFGRSIAYAIESDANRRANRILEHYCELSDGEAASARDFLRTAAVGYLSPSLRGLMRRLQK